MLETITIGGTSFELTVEQSEKIAEILKAKKNPFERAKKGKTYYYINYDGEVGTTCEDNCTLDDRMFNAINYCTDKAPLEKRALEETLSRLLWRFAEINNEHEPNWKNFNECKYFCCYNYSNREWQVNSCKLCGNEGATHFSSSAIAERAIREIIEPFCKEHPEIVG